MVELASAPMVCRARSYRKSLSVRRGQLIFAIGFAVSRSRELLRDIVCQHVTDDTRHKLGRRGYRAWSSTKNARHLGSGRRRGRS